MVTVGSMGATGAAACPSSSLAGRRPLMTGDAFRAWHSRWTAELVDYWGSTGAVKIDDYLTHWPGSRKSFYNYARRFLHNGARTTG